MVNVLFRSVKRRKVVKGKTRTWSSKLAHCSTNEELSPVGNAQVFLSLTKPLKLKFGIWFCESSVDEALQVVSII